MGESRLREALELLDGGRRWFGKDFPDVDHPHCIGLALAHRYGYCDLRQSLAAITADADFQRDAETLSAVVRAQYPERCIGGGRLSADDVHGHITPTVWFNNHPDTTFADVELVMEKAAIMREEACDD